MCKVSVSISLLSEVSARPDPLLWQRQMVVGTEYKGDQEDSLLNTSKVTFISQSGTAHDPPCHPQHFRGSKLIGGLP